MSPAPISAEGIHRGSDSQNDIEKGNGKTSLMENWRNADEESVIKVIK
ncbi:hypothetical protein [Gracilibacillus oryzae]|nr:hypothetical protein [Gracilibacillus oryzae]